MLTQTKVRKAGPTYREQREEVAALEQQIARACVSSDRLEQNMEKLEEVREREEEARQEVEKQRRMMERDGAIFRIAQVNNRNKELQERLDKERNEREAEVKAGQRKEKLNPFARREMQPQNMWDMRIANNES